MSRAAAGYLLLQPAEAFRVHGLFGLTEFTARREGVRERAIASDEHLNVWEYQFEMVFEQVFQKACHHGGPQINFVVVPPT